MKTFEQVVKENPNLEWKDISERTRVYVFPYPVDTQTMPTAKSGLVTVTIENTVALHISKSGGHRIIDAKGNGWYIPRKWIAIHWTVNDGTETYRF